MENLTAEQMEQHFVQGMGLAMLALISHTKHDDASFRVTYTAMLRALIKVTVSHACMGDRPVARDTFLALCAEIWDAEQAGIAMTRRLAAEFFASRSMTDH